MMRVDCLTEPPVVGETYLVPCVEQENGTAVPLLGPVHADPDHGIDAPYEHGHVDARFLVDADVRVSALALSLGGLKPGGAASVFVSRAVLALPVADLADFLAGNMVVKAFRPALLLLPFVCTRLAPRAKPAPWRDQLEAAYAGQTLSPAGLCARRAARPRQTRP